MMHVPIDIADQEYIESNIQGKPLRVRFPLYIGWICAILLHLGQTRRVGGPAVKHPMVVAELAKEIGLGVWSQLTALLHDVIEDKRGFMKVVATFIVLLNGPIALIMVCALTNWYRDVKRYFAQIFRFTRVFWVIIVVKMLDRLHNLTCPYAKEAAEPVEIQRLLKKERNMLVETLGPFDELCQKCRQHIPPYFRAKYDELLEQIMMIAQKRLDEIEPLIKR